MIIALGLCVLGAIGLGYMGWGRGKENANTLFQGVAILLAALSIGLGFLVHKDSAAKAEIAHIIEPMPDGDMVEWSPPVAGRMSRYWVVTTRDGPDRVLAFYQDASHHQGWEVGAATNDTLHLHRAGQTLSVQATTVDEQTRIVFTLVTLSGPAPPNSHY